MAFACIMNLLLLDIPPLSGYVHMQSLSICKTSEKGYRKAYLFLHGGKNLEELAECSLLLIFGNCDDL
jgi:hypothetical protein